MRLIRLSLVACLMVGLAGCGSDDDKVATTSTTAFPFTTDKPVDTSFSGEGSKKFCDLIKSFNDAPTVDASASPAQLKENLSQAQPLLAEAVDNAPGEIKADVKAVADAFSGLVAALDKAGYDVTKLSATDFQAFQAMGTSASRLQAYVSRFCT